MKYCINYSNKSHILQEVDEIIIKYDENKILELFTQFIPEHQEQRVIIEIEDSQNSSIEQKIKKIITIYEENPSLKFDLCINNYREEIVEILKSTNLKYFYKILATNWDIFTGLMNTEVSDIYIAEGLGFELDKVAAIAHEKGKKIRVFPNIAQNSGKIEIEDILKFFIRPEDTTIYEQYVDVYEFIGPAQKVDIYYKIYAKDKEWFGDLSEIIIGLNPGLDSRYIIPRFAEKRIKCGKNCIKGNKCHMCFRILELSETLKKANLIVQINNEEKGDNKNG